jgi:hypothetical protein
VLVEVGEIEAHEPFSFDESDYGNMDNWLSVEDIEAVKV